MKLRVNLLGPGPHLIKKEFTGPPSHKVWEILIYTAILYRCSWRIYSSWLKVDGAGNLLLTLLSETDHSIWRYSSLPNVLSPTQLSTRIAEWDSAATVDGTAKVPLWYPKETDSLKDYCLTDRNCFQTKVSSVIVIREVIQVTSFAALFLKW